MTSSLRPSRFISLLMILTSLLLLQRVFTAQVASAALLGSAVLMAGLVAAVRLWFHNSFDAQFVVGMAAALTFLGMLLALTVGLPGADPAALGLVPVTLLVLPVAIGVLQIVDYRRYEKRRAARSGPYAS